MMARARSTQAPPTQLERLSSISRELAVQLNLHTLLDRILQLTLEAVQASSGSLLVFDEAGRVSEGALAYGGTVHEHSVQQLADTFERGLAGWVVEHRQPAVIADTRKDPRWLQRNGNEGDGEASSAACVPLMARGRVAGVLTLGHPKVDHFGEQDLALLTVVADQAGIALDNARLFEAEQERRRFASRLQEIARTINSTLDPALVFPQVLEQLERVVAYDSASIFLVDGIIDAVRSSSARVVYVCNVGNLRRETTGMDAADHVDALVRHGLHGLIDVVLVQAAEAAEDDLHVAAGSDAISRIEAHGARVVAADLVDREHPMWHDPDRLYAALAEVW